MNKKLIKNYLYNMAYQILMIISPVITIPFLSRSLGADGIGKYGYTYTLTSYFVLIATMGCDIYGRREISYLKDNLKARSEKFWSIEIIKIISTLITLILYFLFSFYNKNKVILIILSLHLINVPLNIGWYYQGIERFKTLTIRGLILKIVDFLFVVFFIHKQEDLNLYVAGTSFIAFTTFFALWVDLRKTIVKVPINNLKLKYDLKNCILLFLPSIATTLYTLVDKTMLGLISENYFENGYYEQALKINQIFLRIVVAFGTVLLPQIAYFHNSGNEAGVKESVEKALRYVYFIGLPIAFGLSCIANLFVPWFFGEEFFKVAKLLKISGFIILFQGISDILGMGYLVSIKKQNKYTLSLIIGTILNLVLNLIFIKKFYSIGVIYTSLVSEIIIVTIQMLYVKEKLDICHIVIIIKNYLIAGITMYILTKIISSFFLASILNTIFVTIIGSSIYFGILYILKDKITLEIINYLKNYLKKF